MTPARLVATRIREGMWEGVLTAAEEGAPSPPGAPALEASHQGEVLAGLEITPLPGRPGEHAVRLPIPAAILSEGVQTVLFRDPASGETLARLTLVTGVPLEEDLRAEIDLLRAELDLLKRAFRRHCVETAGS